MTNKGVTDLYYYLASAWPLVVRPGADDEMRSAKLRELYRSYKNYDDKDVMDAFMKWTEEHDKFPTVKNIINEIAWAKRKTVTKKVEQRYMMEVISKEGIEFTVGFNGRGTMTWDEFVNHPRNKDHLTPPEWERRFLIRRKEILGKVCDKGPLTPHQQQKQEALTESIKASIQWRKDHINEILYQRPDYWDYG